MACNIEEQSQAHTVLDLPELLETIILTLSMREMQRCRQVSKQWKATIDGSPSIRKALFLEPGTADDLAHDAQILKADPDFFHSGAQNGVSHYAVHPLFVPGWPSLKGYPVEHLEKQATRLSALTNFSVGNTTAHPVFNVVELLESIILHLPMRDMQRSRGVSRQWRETVDGSLPIKKALFLEPGTVADLAHDAITNTYVRIHYYSIHPLLDVRGPPYIQDLHTLKSAVRSLRNCLVAQPPTFIHGTTLTIYPNDNLCSEQTEIPLEAGERFGSLYHKAEKALALHQWDADQAQWDLEWTFFR
ncbi:hypothetical protein LTS10_000121 [Elasticomyces elasticus]|nr:hypothetical protein LTS10_000121 [Elasticomyces elasticus]